MSDVELTPMALLREAGFWGKIPSRGDFVGAGLSPGFVSAWDGWVSAGLAASQQVLGDRWQEAWMEAPVWCFSVAQGLFGPVPVTGLWMPSVDRAGRCFPLVVAAMGSADPDWLAEAEAAGRAALTDLLDPAALRLRIPVPDSGDDGLAGSRWWTGGAPRVAACRIAFEGLPSPEAFTNMLEDIA